MNYFSAEYEEMHNETEQLIRQDRMAEIEINWLPKRDEDGNIVFIMEGKNKGQPRREYMFNGRLKTCRIGDYLVSLENCTCMDFRQRHLPCKHMYKLASRVGVFAKKEIRSKELMADFSKGYADGWKFIVRPCNYESLDIRRQKTLLTQGVIYNFSRGQIFYDTIVAYDVWRKALQKINLSLQIDSVTSSSSFPIVEWVGERFMRQDKPVYGIVNFSVYKPNIERTRLEKVAIYSCRQNEFVELLKMGRFADENGELITLE